MNSLSAQLKGWRTVIFALFLRELQSKFNDKLGLSWAFIEPALFILVLSFIRGKVTGGDVHSIPIFIFMLIGMIGIQSFLSSLNSISTAIKKNKPLYAFRQVHPISAIITSAFLEFSIKTVVIFLLSIAVYLMRMPYSFDNPVMLVGVYLLLWIFATSIALLFSIAAAYIPEIDKIKNFISRPMFFISCVFFSLQDIPKEYWHYFNWNPVVHYIELARYACFTSYGNEGVSLAYAAMCSLVSLFFALSIYHLTWKNILSR
ncbi:ABC transporter permease [Alteromonas ponticola]|uniref:Transport permease protein n=1 Tax=Alteromonas aquimaris TaxID=2998417 RepID=A0ABT3P413_9ALTE|nr:ABC transporter permease [Alteromonas aquimaris]MCW8107514.1 ABC transporter permease [Alteromonas aquimaris]